MNNIRLFMCCHKDFETVPPLFEPIQCGAAISKPVEGSLPDNTGDNISNKNHEYCELTAHYYVWKNINADYYGFCHYRRFFSANTAIKKPYVALGKLHDSSMLGTSDEWMRIITSHQLIVPRSENMGLTARKHYCTSLYHYSEDLDLFIQIISEHFPEFSADAQEYLSQNNQYFCNMFIMDRKHYKEYCNVLFSVLEKFDQRKRIHGDFQSDRTDGYLGEIFTGIYIHHCFKNGTDILEVPRLDLFCSFRKRAWYRLFPPESQRRFLVKKVFKWFRRI
mgnify:CR=1 FL=1